MRLWTLIYSTCDSTEFYTDRRTGATGRAGYNLERLHGITSNAPLISLSASILWATFPTEDLGTDSYTDGHNSLPLLLELLKRSRHVDLHIICDDGRVSPSPGLEIRWLKE